MTTLPVVEEVLSTQLSLQKFLINKQMLEPKQAEKLHSQFLSSFLLAMSRDVEAEITFCTLKGYKKVKSKLVGKTANQLILKGRHFVPCKSIITINISNLN